jgi:hypothetical protein
MFFLSLIISSYKAYSDWLRAGRPRGWSSSSGRGKIFLLSTSSRSVLGPPQPPILWVPGALSRGVKQPEREADHLSPSSAEVKNKWLYTSRPILHVIVLLLRNKFNSFLIPTEYFLFDFEVGQWSIRFRVSSVRSLFFLAQCFPIYVQRYFTIV